MLNGLGICSGIGGLERALEPWVRWVACCEREPYPAGVLLGNTGIPIWDDLETFPWEDFRGKIDIVAAGFPCQDVSEAGLQKGLDGKRSVLVFNIIEGVRKMGCPYIFFENVPPVVSIMGGAIANSLTRNGYDARWITLPVPHESPIKEAPRWFLLAQAHSERFFRSQETEQKVASRWKSNPLDASRKSVWSWASKSPVHGMADGVRFRGHRIKAVGNAVVPAQAQQAFKILSGLT